MEIEFNQDELIDFSPESLAETLFTNEPKPSCSCQIVTEKNAASDLTHIFEILIIILMEGLSILCGGLTNVNDDDLTNEHLILLNPWFMSLGFKINVQNYEKNKTSKDEYSKYYCRIIIRNKLQQTFFIMKKLKTDYHFILNGKNLEENKKKTNIKELYTVF